MKRFSTSRPAATTMAIPYHNRVLARVGLALAMALMLAAAGCDNDPEVTNAPPAAPTTPGNTSANRNTTQPTPQQRNGEAVPVVAIVAAEPVREGDSVRYALAYPTGDRASSSILLEKAGPAEVRVGQPYEYTITVTNLTDAPLSGVTVFESLGQNVEFDSSTPPAQIVQGNESPAGQSRQSQQRGRQQSTTQPGQQGNAQQANAQQAGSRQATTQATTQQSSTQPTTQQARQAHGTALQWFVGELAPRQSRVIRATAVPQGAGAAASCLAVSYQPTLCTVVQVVQPQLQVSKVQLGLTEVGAEGRKIAYLCDTLKYKYTVVNLGTGTAKNVVVSDELPEGLQTADGKQQVSVAAGDIPAGESRDFTVDIRPTKTGEFASRARAKSQTDQAVSNEITTPVREPELAVEVVGPEWQYVNQPVTYSVRVRNNGDVPARNVKLQLQAPGLNEQDAARELGDLPAGQTRTANVTLRPDAGGDVKFIATATSVCEQGEDARGTLVTAIRTIPALVVEMVDNKDPVEVGDTTVYSISVKNQGSGPAKNVSLSATLPQGFEFVEGSGRTEIKASGGELTFATIEQLPPGEIASWWVEAKPTQAADARFELRLNSDYLGKPVPEVEPTRAIQPQQAAARQRAGQ